MDIAPTLITENYQPFSDLRRTVTALADSTQGLMTALYNVETAAINIRPDISPGWFQEIRHALRAIWENTKRFLQDCDAYATDFISLSDFLDIEKIQECSGFMKSLTFGAGRLLRNAESLCDNHDVLTTRFQKYRNLVSHLFSQNSERIGRGKLILSQAGERALPCFFLAFDIDRDVRKRYSTKYTLPGHNHIIRTRC